MSTAMWCMTSSVDDEEKTGCRSQCKCYLRNMTLELPEQELGSLRLTPAQARLELAVGLYAGRRVTLGHGAMIGGVSHTEFMHEIGRRGLNIHYTIEDAMHDVATVDKLCAQRDGE